MCIRDSLKGFDAPVAERTAKVIHAGLELHNRVALTFRKTAIRFHYEFNVRHLANMFQGLLNVKKEQLRTPDKLVQLWLHEAERTYCDLLMDAKDCQTYARVARETAKKYFPGDPDDKIFPTPNIWCHFARSLQDDMYTDVTSFEAISAILHEGLDEYNESNAVMNLVLFEDAIRHVCRVARVIQGSHAMLVGVGGSGKQSLSRLTSFLMGYSVSTITISRAYGVADFKMDIAAMYLRAGQKGESISFLLTDTQITDEKFLVFINDLLASGNIPDLFQPDDKENIINSVRNECKAAGIIDTNDNCDEFFLSKVRETLHLILCFSPVGESCRVRARRFPALVNNTIIDWFHPWPQEALQSVSQRFLGEVDLGSDEQVAQAIIDFMPVSFAVSYTHLRAHETPEHLVCRLLLEKKKKKQAE
eukprot:TRINITY_DN45241_c0_g1_i1.p1 TRINITY_DN45241_c0_g1~~TRINITY_DN45241_c0_g1_i1.p1  ORF type:complete len:419 (-),score=130.09 TRINITY_DN45241_c0_g1_i1:60-1316(-)